MEKYKSLNAVVFILSLSICGLSFFNIYKASASGGLILYSGFDGVDGYQSIGGCNFGDRYGVEYVNKLKSALGSGIFINSFSHADKYAWESDLTGINANSVDFLLLLDTESVPIFWVTEMQQHIFLLKIAAIHLIILHVMPML
ncbi:hypothetical protein [Caldisericum exile]|nr:hypothetical protein [Caldisericum exile]